MFFFLIYISLFSLFIAYDFYILYMFKYHSFCLRIFLVQFVSLNRFILQFHHTHVGNNSVMVSPFVSHLQLTYAHLSNSRLGSADHSLCLLDTIKLKCLHNPPTISPFITFHCRINTYTLCYFEYLFIFCYAFHRYLFFFF